MFPPANRGRGRIMDLSKLNPEQRRAAETLEGPVLILAGAGSGKTRALTFRLANLLDHGVPAWSVLALTFTNKAAREMKDRVIRMIGEEQAEEAWISTFHSTCARILRRDIEKLGYKRSFAIYDDDDQMSVLKEILKKLDIDEKFLPPREMKSKLSDAKNKLLSPDEWFRQSPRDHRSSRIHDVMVEYEKRLRSMNALDFDDLLLKTLELLVDHPPVLEAYRRKFRYVMVDEYQDTNRAQYEMIRLLTAESRNLCVVGDDDQSIYGWRGADIRNILDFEKDYPDATVIKLEQNYRSTANILDAANQVIANNPDRKDKELWTEEGPGDKIVEYCAADEQDEAAWIAGKITALRREGDSLGDMAILYRTNAQSRVPEEMLMRSGIAYKIFGGQKFYERKEIKDILAYLRVLANASDDLSLRRIINVPKRAIGDTTVELLTRHAEENEMPLYSALADQPEELGARARKSVGEFLMLLTSLAAMKSTLPLAEFVDTLIEKTGLEAQYSKEDSDEARARIENIREFRGAVHDFAERSEEPTLESYLENVALVTDLDRSADSRSFVTMMTLHSAKGLEFKNVFIAGLEEGIFPSSRSMDDDTRLAEERRLMYVGITRARRRLFLSRASTRMLYNQLSSNPPSRFLEEISERLITREKAVGFGRGAGQRDYGGSAGRGYGRDYGNRDYGSGYFHRNNRGYGVYGSTSGMRPRAAGPRDDQFSSGFRGNGSEPSARPAPSPKLNIKGKSLDQIPGVSRGFVPSKARENAGSALNALFKPGDRVMHPKFGQGRVTALSGSGANARISISFGGMPPKDFDLTIAPIVKLED